MPTTSVKDEIRQTRPFATKAQEALVALLRTSWMVRRDMEGRMAEEGVTLQQYNVLRILRGAEEPVPTMDVADRMIEQEPGITRLIGRLEAKKLVERSRCLEDGRRVLCGITDAGMKVLDALEDRVLAVDEDILGGLDVAELETLVDLLDRIRARMTDQQESA